MKPNILFIEDHLDNTMPARRIFSQDSYNLMNVGTGIQRVFLVENSDVDVVQPVIDGYDVPHRLRAGKKELLINTPIIAVAAHAMKGDAQKAFDACHDVCMPRPANIQELLETEESFIHKEA